MYGFKTWRIKEYLKRKFEATEMDALRQDVFQARANTK